MVTVVCADPPWLFGDRLPGKGRGAAKHYPCLDVAGIATVMHSVCVNAGDDSVLLLWRVAAMQQEALMLAVALGYVVKSELVWVKLTKTGKQHFGMGRYTRAAHETCLICVRGRALPATRSQRSVFYAPTGAHSEKPSEFYRIVEAMYPDAALVEMFARRVRAGWSQHGDELGKLDSTELST